MVCNNCKSAIPNDSEFCQYCGTAIKKENRNDAPVVDILNYTDVESNGGFSRYNTKKKSKKKPIILTIVAILSVVFIVAIVAFFAIPEMKYRQACDKLNSGSYSAAIEMFEDLNGYRSSENKILEAKYQQACDKLDGGSYAAAIEMFEDLNGYKKSEEKVLEAKYQYVIEHKNNNDKTTFTYLKELKRQDYKDSAEIYGDLYEWRVTVIAVNSSETDETTNETSISRSSPVYFHIKLTGGEPNSSMRITVKPHYPDGDTDEYTFDDKWTDGETGWYGWYGGLYEYPEYGATGTLQCKFYDEDGNLIGSGSVRISD